MVQHKHESSITAEGTKDNQYDWSNAKYPHFLKHKLFFSDELYGKNNPTNESWHDPSDALPRNTQNQMRNILICLWVFIVYSEKCADEEKERNKELE